MTESTPAQTERIPTARPVAFRVPRVVDDKISKSEFRLFDDEDEARRAACDIGADYDGLYLVADRRAAFFAQPDPAQRTPQGQRVAVAKLIEPGLWSDPVRCQSGWTDVDVGNAKRAALSVADQIISYLTPAPLPPQERASPQLASRWTCRRCNRTFSDVDSGIDHDCLPAPQPAVSQQRCPACDRTDVEYKRDARHPFVCRDPWHADDHLRSKKHSQEATTQELASAISRSYGENPDDMAPLTRMCTADNEPVPNWQVYEEQACAILAKYDVRAKR